MVTDFTILVEGFRSNISDEKSVYNYCMCTCYTCQWAEVTLFGSNNFFYNYCKCTYHSCKRNAVALFRS
jgi:hypothetical protein